MIQTSKGLPALLSSFTLAGPLEILVVIYIWWGWVVSGNAEGKSEIDKEGT